MALLSVTRTVNVKVPPVVGVPLITPDALMFIQVGAPLRANMCRWAFHRCPRNWRLYRQPQLRQWREMCR